eukprot:1158389-Pelagomonas_calceolata.AAC.5
MAICRRWSRSCKRGTVTRCHMLERSNKGSMQSLKDGLGFRHLLASCGNMIRVSCYTKSDSACTCLLQLSCPRRQDTSMFLHEEKKLKKNSTALVL